MGENMNNQKIKEEKPKPKQYKVTVSKIGFEKVEEFLLKVNETSKRKIKMADVLEFAVEKLGERDIPEIHDRVYTATDKIEMMLDRLNFENPNHSISRDQLLSEMLAQYESQLKKSKKSLERVGG